MSYEYILTFDNEDCLHSFVQKVSSNSLAVKRGENIELRATKSNSQWSYDVRLVKLITNKCLVQVAVKSDEIFALFNLALLGMNCNIIEDGDEEYISLADALKPGKNRM